MTASGHIADPLDWVLSKLAAVKPPAAPVVTTHKPTVQKTEVQKTERRGKDMELWQKWKDSGHKPEHFKPLYDHMRGLIEDKTRIYKNKVEIPTQALDFEAAKIFHKAAKKYDPNKGAALHTWITNQMQQLQRFVINNQNLMGRIPEYRAGKIGKFKAVRADLTERLGHEPDTQTLAEETGMSIKEVTRLSKELRSQLIASGDTTDIQQMSMVNKNARVDEVNHLIRQDLTKNELIVHDLLFGMGGKPQLKSTGAIAKHLGWHDSKVSKVKNQIWLKTKPYLEEE